MTNPDWMFAYLALGAFAGFVAGMFGVGGGLMLVPLLLILFELQQFPQEHAMRLALGTSMATILFTSFASARKHHQHGAVNWRVVCDITPGVLLGAALGALSVAAISPAALGIFFALFVYFSAAQILLNARPKPSRQLPGFAGMTLTGTLTGWISGLVSIGGGTVIVPFLLWCNLPLRHAIGTSAAVGFPIAAGGTLGYIATGMNLPALPARTFGFVYLPALLWIALAAVLAAPLGAMAAHRMKTGLLRKLFAVLLLVLATNLLWNTL